MRWIFALILTSVAAFTLQAKDITGLYTAEVPSEVSQTQWQQQALQQVLSKVSANPSLLQQGAVKSELGKAANYVKKFEPVQGPKPLLRVSLDEQKVQQFLSSLQVPIWGNRRPEILLWLVEQTPESRQFIQGEQQELLRQIQEQAALRALPVQLPSLAANFVAPLSHDDVWAGNWSAIEQASQGYQADQTVIVLLEKISDSSLRLTWQRMDEGTPLSFEIQSSSQAEAAAQFVTQLTQNLAPQYAVHLGQGAATELQMTLEGVESFADRVKVQQLLNSMLSVNRVQVIESQGDTLLVQLHLASEAKTFLNALALERRLLSLTSHQVAQTSWPETTETATNAESGERDDLFAELAQEMALEQENKAMAHSNSVATQLRYRYVSK